MKKKTILDLMRMRNEDEKVAWVTAYDYPTAYAAEQAGIDMILVGDSGGMCLLGYENTHPVTMDEMIMMAKAVRRGAPNTFIVGDMPQGSYEVSVEEAVRNALRFIKEAGCDAIKLEGVHNDVNGALKKAGIIVMGHLGLTPQSAEMVGGYRCQGQTENSFDRLVKQCRKIENIDFILLEALSPSVGSILKNIFDSYTNKIPVYGIGAGPFLDGQLLICHDILGYYPNFKPKFAKNYFHNVCITNIEKESDNNILTMQTIAKECFKAYISEVRTGIFPGDEHCYKEPVWITAFQAVMQKDKG